MSPRWGGFAPIRKRDQGSPRPAHHGEMALIVGISRYHAWMERDWTSVEGRSLHPRHPRIERSRKPLTFLPRAVRYLYLEPKGMLPAGSLEP